MNTNRIYFMTVTTATLLLAANARCPAQPTSNAQTASDVVAEMQSNFVGKVSFDGGLISNIDSVAECLTRIQTETTVTVLNWALVDNPLPQVSTTIVSVPVVSPYATHDFTAPYSSNNQDLGRQMAKTIGDLYRNCRSSGH